MVDQLSDEEIEQEIEAALDKAGETGINCAAARFEVTKVTREKLEKQAERLRREYTYETNILKIENDTLYSLTERFAPPKSFWVMQIDISGSDVVRFRPNKSGPTDPCITQGAIGWGGGSFFAQEPKPGFSNMFGARLR